MINIRKDGRGSVHVEVRELKALVEAYEVLCLGDQCLLVLLRMYIHVHVCRYMYVVHFHYTANPMRALSFPVRTVFVSV